MRSDAGALMETSLRVRHDFELGGCHQHVSTQQLLVNAELTEKLLGKVADLDNKRICPLHGFVIRKDFETLINAYLTWARCQVERMRSDSICITLWQYTKNAAEILACELAEDSVTRMKLMDVSYRIQWMCSTGI